MFDKILIANRGEIACRVMETARAMGVRTVAVYSDADAGSKHVAMADEAVHIGGAAPAAVYLLGDVSSRPRRPPARRRSTRAMASCRRTLSLWKRLKLRASPLSDPRPDAIRKMGLKDAAKALMEEAGVPVVPGYHGANQDAAFLKLRKPRKIGYPVLIKAVAGGGGKGMRLVEQPEDFSDALAKRAGRGDHGLWQPGCADREIHPAAAAYRGSGLWRRRPTRCICLSAIARCSGAIRR